MSFHGQPKPTHHTVADEEQLWHSYRAIKKKDKRRSHLSANELLHRVRDLGDDLLDDD